jgi:integrase
MATITTRTNGRLQASIMVNGRRHRRDFQDKFQAEAWLAEMKTKLTPKLSASPLPSLTENQQARTWLELLGAVHQRVWRGTKGEKTAMLNGRSVVQFFGPNSDYKATTVDQVDTFSMTLVQQGNGDATINRKLSALSKMLRFAVSRGWMDKAPVIEKKREPQNRLRWLDKVEERALLDKCQHLGKDSFGDLVVFLLDTGARVSEALKLEWRDIDFNQNLVSFWDTKNGHPRSIPMTSRVRTIFQNLNESLGFQTSGGPFKGMNQAYVNHTWSFIRAHMGLSHDKQFVPHALRHTCASRLVQRGVPILTVKEWLGHKSLAVTLRYAHLAPKQLFDAVKVLEDA